MRQTYRPVSLTVLAAILLVGCTPEAPAAPPSATETPLRFASDEEALAAAEKAYGAFMAVSDQIVRDGGVGVERLREHLSTELYAAEEASMAALYSRGEYGIGFTQFTLRIQSYDDESIVAYVCDDQTKSDLLGADGNSVVNPNGLRRIPFEVEFEAAAKLLMVRKEMWVGGGVC